MTIGAEVAKSEAIRVTKLAIASPEDPRGATMARALQSPTVAFSLMGPHAGESTHDILHRKIDVGRCGQTMWAINSLESHARSGPPVSPRFPLHR
jgi:hypothetical protein